MKYIMQQVALWILVQVSYSLLAHDHVSCSGNSQFRFRSIPCMRVVLLAL